LARAFFGDPSLLILDEPNAFLDAEGEAALMRGIAAASKRGAAVLIVAHRPSVLQAANRLLVLEGGRIKLLGPAREVVAQLTAPRSKETAA
jgi:ATP-binding cassette subfamily C protein